MDKAAGKKLRVLVIGPDRKLAKGGMSSVIRAIGSSARLQEAFEITLYASYIDGNAGKRFLYSVWAFLRFLFLWPDYDVFHIHMASRGSTFRKSCYIRVLAAAHRRIILHLHGASWLSFYDGLTSVKKRYVRKTFLLADTVAALSDEWKARLQERLGIENCEVIENGVDCAAFQKLHCSWQEGRGIFLFLGRQGKRKGTYDLIEAAKRLEKEKIPFHLYIAGDGETEEIRKLVLEDGLEKAVTVTGWCGREKREELMRLAGWMVLPSYAEGLPMTLLEGMAAGKPVITTPVGGIPELVEDAKNGYLVEPGNCRQLYEAMKRAVEMPGEEWEMMSRENMQKISRDFSESRMTEKLIRVYGGGQREWKEK